MRQAAYRVTSILLVFTLHMLIFHGFETFDHWNFDTQNVDNFSLNILGQMIYSSSFDFQSLFLISKCPIGLYLRANFLRLQAVLVPSNLYWKYYYDNTVVGGPQFFSMHIWNLIHDAPFHCHRNVTAKPSFKPARGRRLLRQRKIQGVTFYAAKCHSTLVSSAYDKRALKEKSWALILMMTTNLDFAIKNENDLHF